MLRRNDIYDQAWLIKPMQALGYSSAIEINGICFGYANLSLFKMLENDFDRMLQLTQELQTNPIEIDAVEFHQRRVTTYQKIKELNEEVKSLQSNSQQALALRNEISLLQNQLDKDNYLLAFFENIYFIQRHNKKELTEIFASNDQPTRQSPLQAASLTLPDSMLKAGGIENAGNFCSVYTMEDMQNYIDSFQEKFSVAPYSIHPVTLLLHSVDHTICIGYDPEKREWLLSEANQKVSRTNSNEAAANFIFSGFFPQETLNNDKVSFATNLYTLSSSKILLQEKFQAWELSPAMQSMNALTEDKLRFKYLTNDSSLLELMTRRTSGQQLQQFQNLNMELAGNEIASLFRQAIDTNNIAAVDNLLKYGFNPNHRDSLGNTPLIYAARIKDTSILTMLLENKYDSTKKAILLQTDSNSKTALHAAVKLKNTEAINILKRNTSLTSIVINTKNILSGLHERASNKNSKNKNSFSHDPQALIIAAKSGHIETFKNVFKSTKKSINKIDEKSKKTPLHIALDNGHTNIAKILIDNGADVKLTENKFNQLPIHAAAKMGEVEILKYIIKKAPQTINARTTSGFTPLSSALKNNHTQAAKLLIENGAKITPHLLQKVQNQEMAEFLLEKLKIADPSFDINKAEKGFYEWCVDNLPQEVTATFIRSGLQVNLPENQLAQTIEVIESNSIERNNFTNRK